MIANTPHPSDHLVVASWVEAVEDVLADLGIDRPVLAHAPFLRRRAWLAETELGLPRGLGDDVVSFLVAEMRRRYGYLGKFTASPADDTILKGRRGFSVIWDARTTDADHVHERTRRIRMMPPKLRRATFA